MVNWKKVREFVLITLLISYGLAFLFFALGGQLNTVGGTVMAVVYMFIPMTVTMVIQKGIYKLPIRELGVSWKFNKWFFAAWFIPPVIAFATMGVSLFLPGIEFSPDMSGFFERFQEFLKPEDIELMREQMTQMPMHPLWLALIQGLLAGATINAVAGFGEELGWRGFLLKELTPLGFWKMSGFIGLIWGVWHAPLIMYGHNYPEHPLAGVSMMIVWCLLLTPIFIYITQKSHSVIAAAIMHGTLNATVGIAYMMIKGGSDLIIGVTGAAGFIVLAIIDLIIFLVLKREKVNDDPNYA